MFILGIRPGTYLSVVGCTFFYKCRRNMGSRHSAVCIATGWTAEGSEFESRWDQEFSLLHVVDTYSGIHPTSYPISTEAFSPGVKWPVHEADHSPPVGAEVKKIWV
jgi:hypothetical protein